MTEHPWKLVAPWYCWKRQADTAAPTHPHTRPAFQKFDTPDFVRGFVRAPLHSLKFCDDTDRVFQVKRKKVDPLGTRFRRLFVTTDSSGAKTTYDTQLCRTKTRKLYLETHKRYYLVVCELHCDAPGFPNVVGGVCQAGFVVRRRSTNYPAHLQKDAAAHLDSLLALQADIGYLDGSTPLRGRAASVRAAKVAQLRVAGTFETDLADKAAKLAAAETDMAKWRDTNGVAPSLQGWIPGRFPNVGRWRRVTETPDTLTEAFYPLYRLFPDPKAADHPAKGRTIYYGVVPTSSLDTTDRGVPRYDPDERYEVRCFVRRHAAECPPSKAVPDCHGSLVWSDPTEAYQLAAPADLLGTSQRPITIRMPDLSELAAQAAALDLTKLAPVRFEQPQQLNFSVNDQKAEGGSVGDSKQICFFAIPLITIVAFFVLKLFLPVLVFLFNLYFLLAFRLCILPSFKLAGGLDAKLKVIPPGVEIDAELSFEVEGGVDFTADELNAALRDTVAASSGMTLTTDQRNQLNGYSNDALLPVGRNAVQGSTIGVQDPVGPTPAAGLVYEDDAAPCPPAGGPFLAGLAAKECDP